MNPSIALTRPKVGASREQLFRYLIELAVQLESILAHEVVPMMRSADHPLTGRVSSLRQEIKLRALLIGGAQ